MSRLGSASSGTARSTAIQRHYALLQLGFKSDAAALESAHKFLWPDVEQQQYEDEQRQRRKGQPQPGHWGDKEDPEAGLAWEVRLARRYYAKLHREYALADMTRYKDGGIGLRWRTEQEVWDGKGQFCCGNKACGESEGLESFELLFAYVEHGESKQALVKLRCCHACADKLHYRKRKEERRKKRREEKEERRRQQKEEKRRRRERERSLERSRERCDDDDDSDDDHANEVVVAPVAAAAPAVRSRPTAHAIAGKGALAVACADPFERICRELIQ